MIDKNIFEKLKRPKLLKVYNKSVSKLFFLLNFDDFGAFITVVNEKIGRAHV